MGRYGALFHARMAAKKARGEELTESEKEIQAYLVQKDRAIWIILLVIGLGAGLGQLIYWWRA